MSFEIRKLSNQDIDKFVELISVFEGVFDMKDFKITGESHLKQLLENDSFFVCVALSDNTVVWGSLSILLKQYYSSRPLVYIYDLRVKTEFQRQGIGRILILNITEYCKKMAVEELFVQADEEADYAIEFYRSTGATANNVVHFYYPLKGRQTRAE